MFRYSVSQIKRKKKGEKKFVDAFYWNFEEKKSHFDFVNKILQFIVYIYNI